MAVVAPFLTGLGGSGVDFLGSLPPFGNSDAFFARMINMAMGILLNSSIKFDRLDSLQRRQITSAEMISCNFSRPCFWYTEGLDGSPWKWAGRLPEALTILGATNALALPRNPPFVFQYLTGNKGDRLVSTPIPCQLTAGILQFQFWKTSDIKLNVCALDEFDQQLQCDMVNAAGHLSGYTTVTIPASNDPTRIAIFATGNGFIALDDIEYVAQLCTPTDKPDPSQTLSPVNRNVELTTTTTSPTDVEPWQQFERRRVRFIDDASMLICDSFTQSSKYPCRWGTASNAYWTVVTSAAVVVALGNVTVESNNGNSLYERLNANNWPALVSFADAPIGPLVSDPLWCQKGSGQFIFKLLVPPNVSVRVCAVTVADQRAVFCSNEIDATSDGYPGPIAVNFVDPITAPFEIRIIPTYHTTRVENFIVLDEIGYFAEVCSAPPSVQWPGGTDTAAPSGANTNGPIILQFTSTFAPTTQTTTTTTQATTTTTQLSNRVTDPFIIRTQPPPVWPVTQRPIQGITQRSISNVGDIFTNPPRLPSNGIHSGTNQVITQPGRVPIIVGPNSAEASTNQPTIGACQLLTCDFESGTCGYTQGGFFGTTFWERRQTEIGRPLSRHIDIRIEPDTGYFLSALLQRDDDRSAILESADFIISKVSYLRFDIYTATVGARVRVCFDTYREEPYREYAKNNFRRPRKTLKHCRDVFTEVTSDTARQWTTVSALMIPGFEKFFIVADNDNTTTNKYVAVAIDNIRLEPCDQ